MAFFRVGMRVRIVDASQKNKNMIGRQATVQSVGIITICGEGLGVLPDGESIVWTGAYHAFEPIIDKPEPCEADFKESLDHLLSRLKGVEA